MSACASYLFWGMLGQQVVQQTGVFQPQSRHVHIATMFLQGQMGQIKGYIVA